MALEKYRTSQHLKSLVITNENNAKYQGWSSTVWRIVQGHWQKQTK